MKLKNSIVIIAFSFLMIGCSNFNKTNDKYVVKEITNTQHEEDLAILYGEDDPLGFINRRIYYFNGMTDRYVLKPAVTNYEYYAPNFFRRSVHNFFRNFKNISTAINSLLQLKIKATLQTILRFGVNSTVGILGIFDPATTLKIPQYEQTLGMTLAYYGVPTGTYVVAPLLGPSNVRDLTAFGVNSYFVNSLDVYHPLDIDFNDWYVSAPYAFSTKVDAGIFFLESDHVFEYEYMRFLANKYEEFKEKQNKK